MTDDQRTDKAAQLLKSLSHPTRLRILLLLASNGEMTVSAIEQRVLDEQSLISHHLQKMRDNGLLGVRKQGVYRFYFSPEMDLVEGVKRYLDAQGNSSEQTE